MIDTTPTIVEHIASCWAIIRAIVPAGGCWPRINVIGGICRLEYRKEDGVVFAVFSCKGRPLRADDEDVMHAGCNVPEGAERVPFLGQDRVTDYRIGIIGQWRYQVVYRWKEPTHGQS